MTTTTIGIILMLCLACALLVVYASVVTTLLRVTRLALRKALRNRDLAEAQTKRLFKSNTNLRKEVAEQQAQRSEAFKALIDLQDNPRKYLDIDEDDDKDDDAPLSLCEVANYLISDIANNIATAFMLPTSPTGPTQSTSTEENTDNE